ncbi:MAG: MBL fold metallo-hydrolase [Solirubrobacterales bacterium]
MAKQQMNIVFWGVRGSRPVPGPDTVIFGGNTACVEIRIGERLIILDAGTGICNLGSALMRRGHVQADLFITHTHWDHIQGFPFFAPAFQSGNRFVIYGEGKMNKNFPALMRGQMIYEHFPVSIEQMGAHFEFHEIAPGMCLDIGDGITVRTFPGHHPGRSILYRIDHASGCCCYLIDHEHETDPERYQALVDFTRGADVVIYDTHFTDEEYYGSETLPSRMGYGHSTWQEGVKLVEAAGAKQLVLFHHATDRTDKAMKAVEKLAKKHCPNCLAAREGMVITL